jgi:ABC-type transporter Mla subunit MlaD
MTFEKEEDVKSSLREMINRINEDRRRIRLVEQSVERTENSISSLEHAVITQMSDLKIALERAANKMSDVSNRLGILESDIARLNKLLGKTATKIELKQLENFIDLVNPITSKFVTKDELERAFEDRTKNKTQV